MSRPLDAQPLTYSSHTAELREVTLRWPGRNRHASFEPKPQRGNAEERKESDDIGHRRHEHARRDRRIGMEAVEHERHQNAAERPCHKIADHGETDHHAEIGHLEPRPGGDAGDDREGQAVDQPDQAFAGRAALALDNSCVASARTATVMVWVAALPPWLATIGASTASATIFCNSPSNRPSTEDARNAVARLTSSQLKRPRATNNTGSDSSSSRPTPPRARMSSSASCSITATMSSKVMTPTSRSASSTTGVATRS